MKKILIINLRRLGDVFSTAHLINSLTANGENQVSLLTYKESSKASNILKNVSNVYEIDRKELITLKTNKLFSDGFAFEQLFNQISAVKTQEWDQIINYSNDVVGAYLSSYLKESCKQVIGVHYNAQRNVIMQNEWELLFNDVLPVVKYAPIHFVDCYHKMAGATLVKDGEKLNTNAKYNEMAFNNINAVRKQHSTNECKAIGIQLKTADASKDIPEETLHELIDLIRSHEELIPFLLIAPNEDERRLAESFNNAHENELVVVEADLQAMASVLMNMDMLITPCTAIKHIADLTETPVLEVSLGHAPFLKQGTYSKDSLILTDVISNREFTKENATSGTAITALDIMSCMLYALTRSKSIKPRLSTNVTLYQSSFDQMGIRYTPVAGTVNTKIEIHRLMSRQLISTWFEQNPDMHIYQDVCNLDLNAATEWTNSEKTVVTSVMKDILGTLRSLLQSAENKKSSKDFVMNLGKLISHIDSESLVQIPVSMFKSKIEAINVKSFEENSKEVEMLLYELKSDMQKILQCLQELEVQINSSKMDDMITRNLESTKL
ncbi:glycosyltransferase family 9 protein [Bacteriovorax sp. PP10]|uniref:Glycosyltransferase family 9 protein n=1 Tax=Bacteriovorax antarcticus TaxID=3088717 RepID=A0ABU5VNT4_9BACT|nr:glycosyltransferase family 9 protein [Bacteriovorax sp. PP10]MEA9354696.1 glycosyltransferase family 9 protein [Bacteriovorax sp. PP10]